MQVIRFRIIQFADPVDTSSIKLTNKYSPQHPIPAHLQYIYIYIYIYILPSLPHVTKQIFHIKRNMYLVIPHWEKTENRGLYVATYQCIHYSQSQPSLRAKRNTSSNFIVFVELLGNCFCSHRPWVFPILRGHKLVIGKRNWKE